MSPQSIFTLLYGLSIACVFTALILIGLGEE